jgi:hypothetical protein
LLRARGARDYQPAAEVLPVGEALPPRPRQVNRLLEKLGRAKCPIIGAGRGVIGAERKRKWRSWPSGRARCSRPPCPLADTRVRPPSFQAAKSADSDEVARAFRDDVARYSDMMSPGVRCLAGG